MYNVLVWVLPDLPTTSCDMIYIFPFTDPNISASRGSPLTVACRFKHEDVVKVLIKYGADPLLDVSSEGNVLHSIAISSTVSIAEVSSIW